MASSTPVAALAAASLATVSARFAAASALYVHLQPPSWRLPPLRVRHAWPLLRLSQHWRQLPWQQPLRGWQQLQRPCALLQQLFWRLPPGLSGSPYCIFYPSGSTGSSLIGSTLCSLSGCFGRLDGSLCSSFGSLGHCFCHRHQFCVKLERIPEWLRHLINLQPQPF